MQSPGKGSNAAYAFQMVNPPVNKALTACIKAQFGPASPAVGVSHINITHIVKSYSRSCNKQHYFIVNWIPDIDTIAV